MFTYTDIQSALADIDLAGEQAWVGHEAPDPERFVTVDLRAHAGYRHPASHAQRFDSVWLAQEAVFEQGWRILLDSCLRMLKPQGVLVLRYVQNQYLSIPAVKNFLYRKYGLRVSVLAEAVLGGEFLTAFEIERASSTLIQDKTWTFGILTQGKKVEVVERFCRSVREHGGFDHQILIVGPKDPAYAPYRPDYIEKSYSQVLSDICIKKNDIVSRAKHENLCILHDRYWLNEDFFSGFDEFGYDFDFLTIRQHHESGKNYPSYCAINDRCHLIWGPIFECGNEHQTWNTHYLNGGLIIAKREVLRTVPFNALIFHNQAEDVELASQMAAHSIVPRINRLSSAVTDVADHLTDAFTLAPSTDYDAVFFPPAPLPTPEPSAPVVEAAPEPTPAAASAAVEQKQRNAMRSLVREAQRALRRIRGKKRADGAAQPHAFLHSDAGAEITPSPADEATPASRTRQQPPEADGLNVILYAGDPGGVVNLTIHYMRSLQRRGIPFCIVDIQRGSVESVIPEDLKHLMRMDPVYPTNVWCIGFPFMAHHLRVLHAWAENKWNANFTHWELPHIPARLKENFDVVDSVIVTTEFVRDAIAEITDKPIQLIDPEVTIPLSAVAPYDRAYFGLPDKKVLFLLNWEFTSSTIRKNPEAGLRAFHEAFRYEDNAVLVMHVKFELKHGEERLQEYKEFLAKIRREYPNVLLLETHSFSYEEALGLKRACDCYVSLHRAEGYGMGCAEALALDRRCVMTGWSGNLQLLKTRAWRDRIYTVAASLVPVTPADYPWVDAEDEVDQYWANVRHIDAVAQLQQAYDAIQHEKLSRLLSKNRPATTQAPQDAVISG